jgi:hypothetical protein
MFHIHGGKHLSHKVVHNWSAKNHLGGKCFTDHKEVKMKVLVLENMS